MVVFQKWAKYLVYDEFILLDLEKITLYAHFPKIIILYVYFF